MPRLTATEARCRHGRHLLECGPCVKELADEHDAILLASRDPEEVDDWRHDYESWVAGDPTPPVTCPEVCP